MASYNYGGQAVIEGVMMRGQKQVAVAIREPAGSIIIYEEVLPAKLYTSTLFKLPLIRGVFFLWEMLVLGTRLLLYSANMKMQHQGQKLTPRAITTTVLISLAFSVGLFFVSPLLLASLGDRQLHGGSVLSTTVEGVIRLAFVLVYLNLVGKMDQMQRVFAYHGAEHKTVNAYEAGDPLDVLHVRQHSTLHTRCGTGFLLVVVVLSLFVFALVPTPSLLLRLLSRVLLIPLIAGLAYEVIRLGARYYPRSVVVRLLLSPCLALQKLTTREPDDSQLEVAIAALTRVLERDGVSLPPETAQPALLVQM